MERRNDTGYRFQVTRFRLHVAGFGLQVTGYRVQAGYPISDTAIAQQQPLLTAHLSAHTPHLTAYT